jgi:hypothetical protein
VKSKTGFQLPPDVSFEKQRPSNAWAYVFRHRLLGGIGRILLQELDDGRCHISCEVVGDPSDQRMAPAQFNSLLDQFVTRHCH